MVGYILLHFFVGAFFGGLGTLIVIVWAATRSRKKRDSKQDRESAE